MEKERVECVSPASEGTWQTSKNVKSIGREEVIWQKSKNVKTIGREEVKSSGQGQPSHLGRVLCTPVLSDGIDLDYPKSKHVLEAVLVVVGAPFL